MNDYTAVETLVAWGRRASVISARYHAALNQVFGFDYLDESMSRGNGIDHPNEPAISISFTAKGITLSTNNRRVDKMFLPVATVRECVELRYRDVESALQWHTERAESAESLASNIATL